MFLDLDRNGADAVVARLLALGVRTSVLGDLDRFRFGDPEDAGDLDAIVADACAWRPAVVIVDSVGELIPLYGLSSSNPDEFTKTTNRALRPLCRAGAAVIAIDHLAKDRDSREQGATGTAAKRRMIGGASLRVTIARPFAPGDGGACYLRVHKDRHGGLRAHCAAEREPLAGVFEIREPNHGGVLTWKIHEPSAVKPAGDDDVAELDALDPPPKSKTDVMKRLHWGNDRALAALREWRGLRGTGLELTGTSSTGQSESGLELDTPTPP
jgi:hypothetical protein